MVGSQQQRYSQRIGRPLLSNGDLHHQSDRVIKIRKRNSGKNCERPTTTNLKEIIESTVAIERLILDPDCSNSHQQKLASVTQSSVFHCVECGNVFKSNRTLEVHMKRHNGSKPFKCQEVGCKAEYQCKTTLKAHHLAVHDKLFCCHECGKPCFDKRNLELHSYQHKKPLVCSVENCKTVFNTVRSIRTHMLRFHSGAILPSRQGRLRKPMMNGNSLDSEKNALPSVVIKETITNDKKGDERESAAPFPIMDNQCTNTSKAVESENSSDTLNVLLAPSNLSNGRVTSDTTAISKGCVESSSNNGSQKLDKERASSEDNSPLNEKDRLLRANKDIATNHKKTVRKENVNDRKRMNSRLKRNEIFRNKRNLRINRHVNRKVQLYKCGDKGCKAVYKHNVSLVRHRKKNHGEKSALPLNIGNKSFTSKEDEEKIASLTLNSSAGHQESDISTKCDETMVSERHSELNCNKPTKARLYRCNKDGCKAVYAHNASLYRHLKSHRKNLQSVTSIISSIREEAEPNRIDEVGPSSNSVAKTCKKQSTVLVELPKTALGANKRAVETKKAQLYRCNKEGCKAVYAHMASLYRHLKRNHRKNLQSVTSIISQIREDAEPNRIDEVGPSSNSAAKTCKNQSTVLVQLPKTALDANKRTVERNIKGIPKKNIGKEDGNVSVKKVKVTKSVRKAPVSKYKKVVCVVVNGDSTSAVGKNSSTKHRKAVQIKTGKGIAASRKKARRNINGSLPSSRLKSVFMNRNIALRKERFGSFSFVKKTKFITHKKLVQTKAFDYPSRESKKAVNHQRILPRQNVPSHSRVAKGTVVNHDETVCSEIVPPPLKMSKVVAKELGTHNFDPSTDEARRTDTNPKEAVAVNVGILSLVAQGIVVNCNVSDGKKNDQSLSSLSNGTVNMEAAETDFVEPSSVVNKRRVAILKNSISSKNVNSNSFDSPLQEKNVASLNQNTVVLLEANSTIQVKVGPFKCCVGGCELVYANQSNLRRHQKIAHKKELRNYSTANKTIVKKQTKTDLGGNKNLKKGVDTKSLESPLRVKKLQSFNQKKIAAPLPANSTVQAKVRSFKCDVNGCEHAYTFKVNLYRHRKAVHNGELKNDSSANKIADAKQNDTALGGNNDCKKSVDNKFESLSKTTKTVSLKRQKIASLANTSTACVKAQALECSVDGFEETSPQCHQKLLKSVIDMPSSSTLTGIPPNHNDGTLLTEDYLSFSTEGNGTSVHSEKLKRLPNLNKKTVTKQGKADATGRKDPATKHKGVNSANLVSPSSVKVETSRRNKVKLRSVNMTELPCSEENGNFLSQNAVHSEKPESSSKGTSTKQENATLHRNPSANKNVNSKHKRATTIKKSVYAQNPKNRVDFVYQKVLAVESGAPPSSVNTETSTKQAVDTVNSDYSTEILSIESGPSPSDVHKQPTMRRKQVVRTVSQTNRPYINRRKGIPIENATASSDETKDIFTEDKQLVNGGKAVVSTTAKNGKVVNRKKIPPAVSVGSPSSFLGASSSLKPNFTSTPIPRKINGFPNKVYAFSPTNLPKSILRVCLKPYKCQEPDCSATFASVGSMWNHKITLHDRTTPLKVVVNSSL